MKTYEATEQAYKNGYEAGYRDGKNRAMEDIAFPKFLVRAPEPTKEELEDIMSTPVIIHKSKEEIIPIYPYSRWIPVTERLPEEDLPKDTKRRQIRCLVATDKGTVKPCVRQRYNKKVDGQWQLCSWEWNKDIFAKPTHWMPLPEPPKGE